MRETLPKLSRPGARRVTIPPVATVAELSVVGGSAFMKASCVARILEPPSALHLADVDGRRAAHSGAAGRPLTVPCSTT
jgi:hypothetical protein